MHKYVANLFLTEHWACLQRHSYTCSTGQVELSVLQKGHDDGLPKALEYADHVAVNGKHIALCFDSGAGSARRRITMMVDKTDAATGALPRTSLSTYQQITTAAAAAQGVTVLWLPQMACYAWHCRPKAERAMPGKGSGAVDDASGSSVIERDSGAGASSSDADLHASIQQSRRRPQKGDPHYYLWVGNFRWWRARQTLLTPTARALLQADIEAALQPFLRTQ